MSNDFRLNSYLARIGFGGTVGPDFATLAAIHAAHIHAIPFENFDPLLRRPVKLDLASVQATLVDGRRGGYCFEQNMLLKAALEAIGFNVTGLAGRVRWMSPPNSPLRHSRLAGGLCTPSTWSLKFNQTMRLATGSHPPVLSCRSLAC
jgi:N-hydroxyarylamine O-acetyltransferase